MNQQKIQEKLMKALSLAKTTWEEVKMPTIYSGHADETGKIAIAVLAAKIYDQLEDE